MLFLVIERSLLNEYNFIKGLKYSLL